MNKFIRVGDRIINASEILYAVKAPKNIDKTYIMYKNGDTQELWVPLDEFADAFERQMIEKYTEPQ